MIDFLYSTVGIIWAISYMPQIITLVRAQTRCSDISLTSWWIWNYAAFITFLYAVYAIHDFKLILTSSIAFFFINVIIALTIYKRWKYKDTPLKNDNA